MRTASFAAWTRALAAGATVLFLSKPLIAAPAAAVPLEDVLVDELVKCLSSDEREAVFFPDRKFECVKFRTGGKLLASITPQQRDPAVICRSDHQNDQRRLRTTIFSKIATHPGIDIGENGIRLIGAVFCSDEVNLNDLTLPYSLVLDHGVFRYGIRAERFSTRGNFSVEDSFVFDNLFLRHAKIEGSLFARRSFILHLSLIDTEVGRTYLEDSLLHGTVYFERFTGRGDVRFRNAAFPTLLIQQSTIRGRLDLQATEARCSYLIRGGQIDDIYALNVGLGVMSVEQPPAAAGTAALPKKRYEWSRTTKQPYYARFIQNGWAKQFIDEANCGDRSDFAPGFHVTGVDTRFFCLQDFNWETSQSNPQDTRSEINLLELTVSGTAIMNLWPKQANDTGVNPASRILRMHGVSARVLYYDFSDRDRPHTRSIDRLQMDRVHTADIGCGSMAREDQSRLPDPADVKTWLKNNTSLSLQPFVAFIKAFENSGASSTALKVAKADIEYERTHAAWNSQAKAAWDRGTLGSDGLHLIIDYLQNCVTWLTGWIAGYGFRPGQVVWYVVAIVVVFWLLFWFALRVVAFIPDKKTTLRSVGFLFIFDRLFPVYKIRDDNYNIAQYFKRGTGPDQQTFKYCGRLIDCIPATDRQIRWAGIVLDILRAIGIVLAIFLVAAINALVVK